MRFAMRCANYLARAGADSDPPAAHRGPGRQSRCWRDVRRLNLICCGGGCRRQMRRRREQKMQEEAAKPEPMRSLPKTPRSHNTSPSKHAAEEPHSGQILRGGPKTWPPEVVEHVQSLLELGWSSLKVANHYSLVAFGLTPQQIDLVRALPACKKPPPSEPQRNDGLSVEQVEQVRKLILEGKTNTAILNHYSLANTNASEAHIQSVRTALEKEAWFVATGGAVTSPMKKSAAKIKAPPLSKQVRASRHLWSKKVAHRTETRRFSCHQLSVANASRKRI